MIILILGITVSFLSGSLISRHIYFNVGHDKGYHLGIGHTLGYLKEYSPEESKKFMAAMTERLISGTRSLVENNGIISDGKVIQKPKAL